MLSTQFPYRGDAIALLELFASAEALIRWQSEIRVYARDELICSWSDLYFPAYDPRPYKPGVWERGQSEWRACFREAELEAIAEFHVVFDSMPQSLVEGWVDIPDLVKMPEWQRLSKAAQAALEAFREPSET